MYKRKRIVIALGGNALGNTLPGTDAGRQNHSKSPV